MGRGDTSGWRVAQEIIKSKRNDLSNENKAAPVTPAACLVLSRWKLHWAMMKVAERNRLTPGVSPRLLFWSEPLGQDGWNFKPGKKKVKPTTQTKLRAFILRSLPTLESSPGAPEAGL